jgi:predicted DNA-binding antitoxin AbrB/MazE fold protein
MSLEVEAIFENGHLKPTQTLPLDEGQRVLVTIQPLGRAFQRFCGSLRWTREPDELQRFLNDPDESSWSSRDA